MELILILLAAGGIGYLISTGSRGAPTTGGGTGGTTAPPISTDCTTAINTLPEPLRSAVQSAVASPTATNESLMNLAKVLDTCPYPGISAQCTFVAACVRAEAAKKPIGGGTTTPVDDATCTNMINALPETTADDKNLKTSIQTIWASPVVVPSAVTALADQIDNMAASTTDPTNAARLKLVAGCMRTKAAKAAGGYV